MEALDPANFSVLSGFLVQIFCKILFLESKVGVQPLIHLAKHFGFSRFASQRNAVVHRKWPRGEYMEG